MPLPLIKTDDIEVLRTQFTAWMDGVNARFLGRTVPDCPHDPRTAAGDSWENGWDVVNRHLKDKEDLGYIVKQLLEEVDPDSSVYVEAVCALNRSENQ